MDVRELQAKRESGEPLVLVDVREPQEWQFNRIEGAIHIPLGTLPYRASELDPAARTVVYCHHGMRSAQAAAFLRQRMGFSDVHNLEGGIEAWSQRVDPEVPRY